MRSMVRLFSVVAAVAVPMLLLIGTAQAAGHPLTLVPNPVSPGEQFSIGGDGCVVKSRAPGVQASVLIEVSDGSGPFAATPDTNGTWKFTTTVNPGARAGRYTINATCDFYTGSFAYDPGVVTVQSGSTTSSSTVSRPTTTTPTTTSAPSISLPGFSGTSQPHISQGQAVELEAGGFLPGEQVAVVLHSAPIQLARFTADANGSISGSVTIPEDTVVGVHTINLVGETSDRTVSAAIYVIAESETIDDSSTTSEIVVDENNDSDDPILASTGSDVAGMSAAGVGLAVAGIATVLLARRRPRGRHS